MASVLMGSMPDLEERGEERGEVNALMQKRERKR
jgi:hypothetical protein